MICISVDLGLTGAVAALDSRSYQVHDLPITEEGGIKRIDGRLLINLLRQFVPPGEPFACVYEDVQMRQMGNRPISHKTEGSLSRGRGCLEAVLDIMRATDRVTVQPRVWQAHFALRGKDKDDRALPLARTLFPLQAHNLARKKDSNRADALLIGRYYMDRIQ